MANKNVKESVERLWKGYSSAILFSENESDTYTPLDRNYDMDDFDKKTISESKKLLERFYKENLDAINESGLDLDTIGMDVWYTRAGHGAGFFDHSLDDDIEKKLINGAKYLGEYPSVETNNGKIYVSKGRVFEEGGEADSEREDEEREESNERLEELMQEHDLPREVIEEYASNMGIEIDDIDELPFNGRYDSEEDFAEDLVEQGAVSNLSYYLEMTSLDMRLLAQEEADNRVDDMSDDEILDATDMEYEANEYNYLKDEIEDLENDIDNLKSLLDDYLDDEEDLTEGEMEMREERGKDFKDEIDEKENELENLQHKLASMDTYDEIVDKAREELRDVYYDDVHDELERDAVAYFVDNLGYAEEDLAKNNLFSVDLEKLSRDLSHDYTFIEHGGDVYVFASYMGGGMTYAKGGSIYAKGGNLPSIEKRVAEVNAMIKEGNEKGLRVIDEGGTWQSPMKYNPIKYTNGVLYISYQELDLYNHNKGRGTYWKKENYKIGKNEWGQNSFRGNAQTDALTQIARMYRKALNHYNKYGWYEGGGHTQGYDDREDERLGMEHGKISKKDFVGSHETKEHSRRDDAMFEERMAKGGATFDDKVSAIKKRLEGMSVAPKYKKKYGKTYDKSEALSAAKAIAGSMRAKEMSKKKS